MSDAEAIEGEPEGFFIPYRYKNHVRPIQYPACRQIFGEAHDTFADQVSNIESLADAFADFGGPPPAPRFQQDWFARLDLMACYSFVRRQRPRRIVEIGSGHSTRVMARAVVDGALNVAITCIDPKPRAALLDLDVRHISALASTVELGIFDELEAGDILFIDSSHLAQPGTDVDYILNVVVPRLPTGTIIHIHDIFLPDPYPKQWEWRGYNEQSVVAPMLTTLAFRPLFASHYIWEHTNLIAPESQIRSMPLMTGALETSLWIEKSAQGMR